MKKVQQLIANKGVTFLNAFVTTPICCPSRSSILTGKYLHNHHTVNNSVSGGCSNFNWQQNQEKQSFAVPLHHAGYKTFYAGKYLNQYGEKKTGGTKHIPLGWDWWLGLVGNSRYYNFTLSVNGSAKHYKEDYLTDVIKDYALQFIQQLNPKEKFLMMLSPPAPHAPFEPAVKYKDTYRNVTALRTPNFNVPVTKNKHWLMRMQPSPLPTSLLPTLNKIYHRRWETLLSVDDMVESVMNELENKRILNDTFIIYTSDHGFHIGQFGLPWDKRQPYEFDIRVPLLVRGPGIPEKKVVSQPVLNIDLAPTIVDMAGLSFAEERDGKSFLPFLKHPGQYYGRKFLIEYEGEGSKRSISPSCSLPQDNTLAECSIEASCKCQDSRNNTYECIRHLNRNVNFIYCQFEDREKFVEAYDLVKDPYQMQNIGSTLDSKATKFYKDALQILLKCRGFECSVFS
ncbi:hypothetical protein R5R35_011011 [Gryllus longicercus]|uniref:Sulfatase N-terminal domain-containing protein n=1 Tax=Gryllus longicercus TaxID=2509291 RepID=A0AAN9YXV1_9ORTH